MNNNYQAVKQCGNCNLSYYINFNKHEAAFAELREPEITKARCPKCDSAAFQSISYPIVEIDNELMEQWAQNKNLHFWEQDEDIMLAVENMDMITSFIDRNDILSIKRHILISSLCVTIYDKENGYQKAINILSERLPLVEDARSYISGYIGKKVFPKIGLKWKN